MNTLNVLADILIIDDDSTVVIALNKALNKIGRIRFAGDADQAFSMIQDHHPDLILLDVELPYVSGLDICLTLKKDPETASIPVLFITSHTEAGFEEQVFDAGGADYIVKPLKPLVVAARVQTHINYSRVITLLEGLARTDSLTGLANRRTFDEELIKELNRSRRDQVPFTVALVDIDEFKKYNDHFGHIKGDECIKEVAQSLGDTMRRATDLVARYGGEEFAFIFPNTDSMGAEALLTQLLKGVEHLAIPHAPNSKNEYITASLGYSTFFPAAETSPGSDDWAVVKSADHALYESKRQGRNRISFSMLGEKMLMDPV